MLRVEFTVARRRPADDSFKPDDFDSSDDDSFESSESDDAGDDHDANDDEQGSSRLAYCPECAAKIYHAADICPKCFAWIDGDTSRHGPRFRRNAQFLKAVVVWAVIAALLISAGILGVLSIFG